jgi:7-keto-8-aminopelargonate synthetase-like enzyme
MKKSKIINPNAYLGSVNDFRNKNGKNLKERSAPFHEWVTDRKNEVNFPFNRIFNRTIDSSILFNEKGEDMMNFGSQDYLGLGKREDVLEAGIESVKKYGFHTAGSPLLTGRTLISTNVENKISKKIGTESTLIFPTGWMACFAAVAGTVSSKDYLFIDEYSHNCIQVAAKYSTDLLYRFKHNDLTDLENKLNTIRKKDKLKTIFIVLEGLYSMHSDSPDLERALKLLNKYDAILILDIAHDFGSLGAEGRGILETVSNVPSDKVIITGSFSKTFSATGGFVSGIKEIETQIALSSNTYMFSNAISQFQCGIINKCLDIVFSNEGFKLRDELMKKSIYVREKLSVNGFKLWGNPSAIIPIEIDSLSKARFISKIFEENGIVLNLIEFPAVPKSIGLFRFQISSSFSYEFLDKAINVLIKSNEYANSIILNNGKNTVVNDWGLNMV